MLKSLISHRKGGSEGEFIVLTRCIVFVYFRLFQSHFGPGVFFLGMAFV